MVDPDYAVRQSARRLVAGERDMPGAKGLRNHGSWQAGAAVGGLVPTLDDRRDLRAVDADIGQRAVIERHQLVIGTLPLPPSRDRGLRRNKEIDQRHGTNSAPQWCTAKMGILGPLTI